MGSPNNKNRSKGWLPKGGIGSLGAFLLGELIQIAVKEIKGAVAKAKKKRKEKDQGSGDKPEFEE